MNRVFKISLIIAASLLALGLIIFVIAMSALKWDFSKLDTTKYETNEYEMSEDFNDIIIKTDTADITFLPSETDKVKVVNFEQEKANHSVTVENGALKIEINDTRKWYERFAAFSFKSPKITVYLPKKAYQVLDIESDTGDINIPNNFTFKSIDIVSSTGDITCSSSASDQIKITVSTGNINASNVSSSFIGLTVSTGDIRLDGARALGEIRIVTSTGDVRVKNATCKEIEIDGSTSNVKLTNVIASKMLDIDTSTGDITLEECDSGEIYLAASTGNISGTILSYKVFDAEASTGSISVPHSVLDKGKCTIRTSTGDISISVTSK